VYHTLPRLKINQFSPKIKSGSVAHLDVRTRGHVTAITMAMKM